MSSHQLGRTVLPHDIDIAAAPPLSPLGAGVEPDDAIRRMVDGAQKLGAVDNWDSASKHAAKDALQAAVDTAFDAGVSWQAIGARWTSDAERHTSASGTVCASK
jgi:hypothetical protein